MEGAKVAWEQHRVGPAWLGNLRCGVWASEPRSTDRAGQAALTILEGLATLPAIAITDLQMRGGSGEELARTLARHSPDLPVIFMTAYLARYRTAYLPGPILEKPFRADQLCELVSSVLAGTPGLQSRGLGPALSRATPGRGPRSHSPPRPRSRADRGRRGRPRRARAAAGA